MDQVISMVSVLMSKNLGNTGKTGKRRLSFTWQNQYRPFQAWSSYRFPMCLPENNTQIVRESKGQELHIIPRPLWGRVSHRPRSSMKSLKWQKTTFLFTFLLRVGCDGDTKVSPSISLDYISVKNSQAQWIIKMETIKQQTIATNRIRRLWTINSLSHQRLGLRKETLFLQ